MTRGEQGRRQRGWTVTEVAALVVIGLLALLAAAHLAGWFD